MEIFKNFFELLQHMVPHPDSYTQQMFSLVAGIKL